MTAERKAPAPRYSAPVALASTFRTIGRYAPGTLVSPAALERVRAMTASLPAALTSWVYFETRLAAGSPQVDVVLEIGEQGRAILAGENPRIQLSSELLAHPAWRRIEAFCREWGDPTSALYRIVDHIWLELDVPVETEPGVEPLPVPGIFICFDEFRPPDYGAREWYHRALHTLESLTRAPVPSALADRLGRCFVHLPESAYIPYVGKMMGRAGDSVRVCVNDLTDDAIPEYLAAIGWTGSARTLAATLDDFRHSRTGAENAGVGMLHLDIGAAVQPRIGLEYSLAARPQYKRTILEESFLDRLVQRGLCALEKRNGCRDWLGYSIEVFPHELWRSVAVRRVNHVKILYDPSAAMEAKMYLLGCFQPHAPGSPRLDTRRERLALLSVDSSLGGFPQCS